MKMIGSPETISFLNKRLCFKRSNALVISIVQAYTSEPFLIKYPIVSKTAHVHMVVDVPGWYAYCRSSKPRLSPNRIRMTQSMSLRTILLIAIDR